MQSQAREADGLLGVVVAVAVMAAGGCTICPSPYDYSGPVPNGSVTQNDFCARSGGTRPLRSSPLVWPQVVQSEEPSGPAVGELPAAGGEADDPSVLVAAATEEDAGEVVTTSAEVAVGQEESLSWRRLTD